MLFNLYLQASSPMGQLGSILPLVAIFAIFYFLLFMPMQKQRKQQQKMLRELQNGNVVVTSGGIVGTIVSINEDDTLVLRVNRTTSSCRSPGTPCRPWCPPRRKRKNKRSISAIEKN